MKIKADMKYISEDDPRVVEPGNTTISFNKQGEKVSSEKEEFFAKMIVNNSSQSYYIRTHEGILFDPGGMNSYRVKFVDTKMRKVSKVTFDFYMIYLKTKNNIYLTRAQRSFLDG